MKRIRKIFAMFLAMAMVLGMGITAFAAETQASITVNGLATNASQTISIYQIYSLDADNNAWVLADWAKDTGVTPETLTTKASLDALKEAAGETTATDTLNTTETVEGSKVYAGSATFSGLQAGAYLILVTDSSNKTTYSTMVAATYEYGADGLIKAKDTSVTAKAEGYHIDKTTSDADDVVEVGDLLTYTIRTTVPYCDPSAEKMEFAINDTIQGASYYLSGADVKGVAAVSSVTVGGKTINGIAIPSDANGQKTFTVDLSSLVSAQNAYAGQEVVITYTAKVEAVDSITNAANSTHQTTPVITISYTGQASITKYNDDKSKELKGAQFALYKLVDGEKFYAAIDANGYITGEWLEETDDGAVPNGAGIVTTGEDGVAVVKGLNVGTYYFKEVKAPKGYTVNESDAAVNVVKVNTDNQVSVSGTTEMKDTKLTSLPSTGGIGTTIFTIGGCAVMSAAAGLYFVNRKKNTK